MTAAAARPDAPLMDPRGLVEIDARVAKVSEIDGTSAEFDAKEMTTRRINLELRWLLYEQGVTEVTVRNPGAKHSLGAGILTRCRINFEGSLGYFGLGMIDGPEVQIAGRVGWSARRSAAATWSSRAASVPGPESTRRAGRSSRSATPVR